MTIEQKINKSQGMYPTPTMLTDLLIRKFFTSEKLSQVFYFVEPGAGNGNFIISYWDLCYEMLDRSSVNEAVSKTIAFENDKQTFSNLQERLSSWLKSHSITSRPKIIQDNFLLSAEKHLENIKNDIYFVGNPPWDEFTTRKHDDLNNAKVAGIRKERDSEGAIYRAKGYKNMYQAFLDKMLEAPKYGSISMLMVLPRQVLGDKSSSQLRETMLLTGELKINVYKNCDNKDLEFPFVDRNFEICILNYQQSDQLSLVPSSTIQIARGIDGKYHKAIPIGQDLTIPCPKSKIEMPLVFNMLKCDSLGSWLDEYEVEVSMGKVKHNDPNYKECVSGRTISPYQISGKGKYKLVVNKILPNSERKIKAALIPMNIDVNESLIEIRSDDQDTIKYLYLMLNSKHVDSTLRALMSNINLNIFRLKSLPIPKPTDLALKSSRKFVDKILARNQNPNEASSKVCDSVYGLSKKVIGDIEKIYIDHRVSDTYLDKQVA